jgi:uncharacterized membrane protein
LRIKIGSGLLLVNVSVILLILCIVFFPVTFLRVILGVPLVVFFPGYVLTLALLPRKGSINTIERVALSLGLSLALVPLVGLFLNYTPVGITLYSILYSIAFLICFLSLIAWFRRSKLPEGERFSAELYLRLPPIWHGNALDKWLSIALALSVVGTFAVVGLRLVSPKPGDEFTEFYLLGLEGKASGYPTTLKAGDEGKVLVGVVSYWRDVVDYRLEVRIDGVKNNEVGPIILKRDEKWEKPVSFTPQAAGPRHKVEFLLYKLNETEPCVQPLWLWIDVTQ